MDIPLLIANVIALISLIVHLFLGDKDVKTLEPDGGSHKKLENWILARAAFHVFSVDMLMITIGLTLLNFTSYFAEYRTIILKIICTYFLLHAISFFFCVIISKPLPKKLLKLGQWALLLVLSSLIYYGI